MHDLVILIARYFIVLPVLLLAITWFRLARPVKRQAIVVGVIAAVVTAILAILGSKLYNDPRPFVVGHFTPYFPHGNDNGFPSDHTLFAGLCAWITLLYNKKLGLVSMAVAVLIGASRVIAGVHHLADIMGALIIAGVGVALAWLVVRRWPTQS